MKILVTGGAGFIGSHLVDALIKQGHEVTVLDNLSSGKEENINNQAKLIKHDIIQKTTLPKFDEIYHLASLASPAYCIEQPFEIALCNTVGTYNMLIHALRYNSRILFASSSEVYGIPEQHPQCEEYNGNVSVTDDVACYRGSKRLGETLCLDFYNKFKMDVRIVRIFNTYGERMPNDGRVMRTFITQALKNEPITIHRAGEQTRSFCYVSEMVAGLLKLMKSDYNLPLNIGNPEEITILELAKKIKKLTQSKSELVFVEGRDEIRRCPDITKAKKILNWQPKVSLEEGLKKMINWVSNENTT